MLLWTTISFVSTMLEKLLLLLLVIVLDSVVVVATVLEVIPVMTVSRWWLWCDRCCCCSARCKDVTIHSWEVLHWCWWKWKCLRLWSSQLKEVLGYSHYGTDLGVVKEGQQGGGLLHVWAKNKFLVVQTLGLMTQQIVAGWRWLAGVVGLHCPSYDTPLLWNHSSSVL